MTATNAPGKHYRKGITLMDAVRRFDTEDKAEAWFVAQRWPNGVICPGCASDQVSSVASRKPQPFRCRACRKCFSVKTESLLHSSNIPLSKWAIAFYLYNTNLKGVSSMKLHRDLGITQKSAWYMAHRIREMWTPVADRFAGPVEADETYVGGKEANKHEWKKEHAGRGAVGKAAVIGMKDRPTNQMGLIYNFSQAPSSHHKTFSSRSPTNATRNVPNTARNVAIANPSRKWSFTHRIRLPSNRSMTISHVPDNSQASG